MRRLLAPGLPAAARLADGQQLLRPRWAAAASAPLRFTQLALRPAGRRPPTQSHRCHLLLAYLLDRTIVTYHLATGERLRCSSSRKQPRRAKPLEAVSAAGLDALGEDEAAFSPSPPVTFPASGCRWRGQVVMVAVAMAQLLAAMATAAALAAAAAATAFRALSGRVRRRHRRCRELSESMQQVNTSRRVYASS